jgi:hypothetical protein
MSPMDLLLVTPGPHTQYKAYKASFYHGNTHAVSQFLNMVEAEKCRHEKLCNGLGTIACSYNCIRRDSEGNGCTPSVANVHQRYYTGVLH